MYNKRPKTPKKGDIVRRNFWSTEKYRTDYDGSDGRWKEPEYLFGRLIITGLGVLILVVALLNSFFINSAYEKSVVTRFGKMDRVVGEGIHFKYPFVENSHIADLRLKKLVLNSRIAMKGGANIIELQLTVNHQINSDDASIKRLFIDYGPKYNYEGRLLSNVAKDRVKSIIGKYSIEGFLDSREQVRSDTKGVIVNEMVSYGILIKDIQLSDIKFSDSYVDRLKDVAKARAMAAQAEQQARKAEFVAKATEAQALGEANALKLSADANAYQTRVESTQEAEKIRRLGEANADAIRLQNEAARNATGLAELRKAEALKNWDGTVPQFMSGGQSGNSIFPFLNMNKMMENK